MPLTHCFVLLLNTGEELGEVRNDVTEFLLKIIFVPYPLVATMCDLVLTT